MSNDGQCLHACHMAVNVSKQIFMTQKKLMYMKRAKLQTCDTIKINVEVFIRSSPGGNNNKGASIKYVKKFARR